MTRDKKIVDTYLHLVYSDKGTYNVLYVKIKIVNINRYSYLNITIITQDKLSVANAIARDTKQDNRTRKYLIDCFLMN